MSGGDPPSPTEIGVIAFSKHERQSAEVLGLPRAKAIGLCKCRPGLSLKKRINLVELRRARTFEFHWDCGGGSRSCNSSRLNQALKPTGPRSTGSSRHSSCFHQSPSSAS